MAKDKKAMQGQLETEGKRGIMVMQDLLVMWDILSLGRREMWVLLGQKVKKDPLAIQVRQLVGSMIIKHKKGTNNIAVFRKTRLESKL